MNKPTTLDLSKSTTGATIANTGAGLSTGLGIAGTAIPMITSMLPKDKYSDIEGNDLGSVNNMGGDILSNAASGASMGMALGPYGALAGGIIGAGYGALTNNMASNDMKEKQKTANIQIGNRSLNNKMTSNANQYTKQEYNNDNMVFANGGMININSDVPNASEEVELGESAITPDGQHLEFGGEKHENGGLKTNLPSVPYLYLINPPLAKLLLFSVSIFKASWFSAKWFNCISNSFLVLIYLN